MSYIAVDDVDKRVDKAKKAGATILREPFDVPGVGRIAILKQPGGGVDRLDDAGADVERPGFRRRLTWTAATRTAAQVPGMHGPRQKLLEIIRRRSFREKGAFKLASGRMSTIYFNLKPNVDLAR